MSDLSSSLDQMRSLIQQGKFLAAEQVGLSVYQAHSDDVALNKGLALATNFLGRLREACNYFAKAVELAPMDWEAKYNLATLCLTLGYLNRAERLFEELLAQGQVQAVVYQNYINVLLKQKNKTKAIAVCETAYGLYPDHFEIGSLYVAACEEANKLDQAREILNQLPASSLRALMAARLKRRDKRFAEALAEIENCKLEDLDHSVWAEYYLERGLIQDKNGNFDDAFRAFEMSNDQMAEQQKQKPVSAQKFMDDLELLQSLYNQPYKKRRTSVDGKKVAFFVGFPRSGTTLMEQMLKSHSKIVTTDEKSPFEALIQEELKGKTIPELWESWEKDDLTDVRQRFWDIVREFGFAVGDGQLLVDKLPLNIVWVPFIRQLFPDCPLLIAYRDPRDVCLSAFMQKFTLNNAMANFLTWDQTGKTYDKVMSVWAAAKAQLDEAYFAYRYEDLIDGFEDTIKRVIDYLGLEFEEGVYTYRDQVQKRDVNTPSYREVVNPLNKDAIDRWKNYPDQVNRVLPYFQKWVEQLGYKA